MAINLNKKSDSTGQAETFSLQEDTTNELLGSILVELRILNQYFSLGFDEELTEEDTQDEDSRR